MLRLSSPKALPAEILRKIEILGDILDFSIYRGINVALPPAVVGGGLSILVHCGVNTTWIAAGGTSPKASLSM